MRRPVLAALAVLVVACSNNVPGPAGCLNLGSASRQIANLGPCAIAVDTDRRSYTAEQDITVTETTTATAAGCTVGPPCIGPAVSIQAATGGQTLWKPPQLGMACPMYIRVLQPGETASSRATWTRPTLPPGSYSVAGRGGAVSYFKVC